MSHLDRAARLGLALGLLAAPAGAEEAEKTLRQTGLAASGSYTADLSLHGTGQLGRRSAVRGLLEIGLTLELESLGGPRGGTLFAGLQSFHGRNGSDDLGDFQGYSNIDAEPSESFAEIWYEQRLAGDRLRLKLGSVDANTEFAFVDAAGEFINSSAGFSPTILTFPTYPAPEPGINLFLDPDDRFHIGVGVYRSSMHRDELNREGAALFHIGEFGFSWSGGRLAIGAWHDSAELERLDGGVESGTWGDYALVELRPSPALSLFAQLGRADETVGEAARHASLGAVAEGVFSSRPGDRLGAMLSFVDLSDAPGAAFEEDETALELFYGLRITPNLRLQPDLQYVLNPGGAPGAGNALVATLRVEISVE